jgi:hypothetical protein
MFNNSAGPFLLQPESDPADAVSPGAASAAAKQRRTHQDGQDPTFGGHEHGAVVAESERLRLSLQLEVAPDPADYSAPGFALGR